MSIRKIFHCIHTVVLPFPFSFPFDIVVFVKSEIYESRRLLSSSDCFHRQSFMGFAPVFVAKFARFRQNKITISANIHGRAGYRCYLSRSRNSDRQLIERSRREIDWSRLIEFSLAVLVLVWKIATKSRKFVTSCFIDLKNICR